MNCRGSFALLGPSGLVSGFRACLGLVGNTVREVRYIGVIQGSASLIPE